jgi:hypothetical protein
MLRETIFLTVIGQALMGVPATENRQAARAKSFEARCSWSRFGLGRRLAGASRPLTSVVCEPSQPSS